MTTQQCYTDQELSDFELGNLSGPRHEELARHLDECPSCAARFEQLAPQSDPFLDQLRLPLPDEILQDDSELADLSAKAAALLDTNSVAAGETSIGETQPAPSDIESLIAQVLTTPQSPDELGRLGAYRVLKVLGVGGMGIVFQAEDTLLQRSVALKVMKPHIASDPSARERFLREARGMAAVEHDHVATIHQVGEEENVPFLAMPLLKGESLATRLRRERKLPADEALRITREVCSGLAAAHATGLVHRDIKPDNIWLESPLPERAGGQGGRVKILDFGLARAIDAQKQLTQSGLIVGTPNYLSPEQASGTTIDARSDVYSLGVVLYEMLSGVRPFQRDTLLATLNAIGSEEPSALNNTVPDLDSRFTQLVGRLLSKTAELRFQSAGEVIQAIDDLSASRPLPTVSSDAGTTPPLGRRSLAWFGGLALVVVLGIIVTMRDKNGKILGRFWGSDGTTIEVSRDDKTDPVRPVESVPAHDVGHASPTKSAPPATASVDSLLPLSPLALTSMPEKIEGLKSWSLETRLHRGGVYAFAASHDGKFVASAGYDGTVRVWRTEDFEPVQVLYLDPQTTIQPTAYKFHGGADYRQSFCWSRDGKFLAFATQRRVVVLRTETWEEVYSKDAPLKSQNSWAWHLDWSNTGLLLIVHGMSDSQMHDVVQIVDVKKGRVLRSLGQKSSAFYRWHNTEDQVLMTALEGEGKVIVKWDVHSGSQAAIGALTLDALYAPTLTRYVVRDSENQRWEVKSREGDSLLCSIHIPQKLPESAGLTWSPNGRLIAWTDFETRQERIIDVDTGEEVPGSGANAYNPLLRWFPDSSTLLLRVQLDQHAANEPTLQVVDITSGDTRKVRIVHSTVRNVPQGLTRFDGMWNHTDVLWSPDSRQLLTQGSGLWKWDLDGNLSVKQLDRHDLYKSHVTWPQQNVIVGTTQTNTSGYASWNLDVETKRLRTSEEFGFPMRVSADGRQAVFVALDDPSRLRIVDPINGQLVRELTLKEPVWHRQGTWGNLSLDGSLFAVMVRSDPQLKIWSLETGELLDTVDAKELVGDGPYDLWQQCQFSPDNKRAVLRMRAGGMQSLVWDVESHQLIRKLHFDPPIPDHTLSEVAWIDNDRFIHAVGPEGLHVYDRDGNLLHRWLESAENTEQLSVSPDRSRLACTTGPSTGEHGYFRPLVRVLNMTDGSVLSTHCLLPTEYDYDLPFSFSPTGHWNGGDELRDVLNYVTVTEDGQQLFLTPAEFEEK
ncbi:MAG: protein kinase, partial [Planctomycetaceae bacterium]|nr:protein kinase [Planctomycetaceae bacterium]